MNATQTECERFDLENRAVEFYCKLDSADKLRFQQLVDAIGRATPEAVEALKAQQAEQPQPATFKARADAALELLWRHEGGTA